MRGGSFVMFTDDDDFVGGKSSGREASRMGVMGALLRITNASRHGVTVSHHALLFS